MKKNNNKSVLIVIGLIGLWAILTIKYVVFSDISLSVLSKKHVTAFKPAGNRGLYAKQKISAVFTADSDYLGMVEVRINTFNRINQDFVIFRIKDTVSGKWWYENHYDTLQFNNDELYPFGFPIINNSKGKKYLVEIESTLGRAGNNVSISNNQPNLISKYKIPKAEIIKDTVSLFNFLKIKIVNSVKDNDLIFIFTIYSLPLLVYIFDLRKKGFFIFAIGCFFLYHLFFISGIQDELILILVAIASLILGNVKKISLFYALLVVLALVGNWFFDQSLTEKTAVYAFLFFVSGLVFLSERIFHGYE